MNVGDIIPLYMQLADYNTSKYVRAYLRDMNGNPLSGSPVNLTAIANGLYGNLAVTFPAATTLVTAQYLVYDDSGYTELSSTEGGGLDVFYLTEGGSASLTSNLIGVVDDGEDCACPTTIQDTIVLGSDRTLTIRLISQDNGEPFDLTGATNLQCRFQNADGTILVLSLTDMAAPITVVSAPAGKFTCDLTAAETALLMPGSPVPFTVVVTQSAGISIANFLTQLAVQQKGV